MPCFTRRAKSSFGRASSEASIVELSDFIYSLDSRTLSTLLYFFTNEEHVEFVVLARIFYYNSLSL